MSHLKVAVRIRPLSQKELCSNSESIVTLQDGGNTIAITNLKVPEQNAGDSRERIRRFTFDYCFQPESTQDEVFEAVGKEIAKSIGKRYHSCVLAYGQSSSGKTHTMMGNHSEPGLTPKLCENIFAYLKESSTDEEIPNIKAAVSYLEIYNEKVRDLLSPNDNSSSNFRLNPLKVREHPKKGPYVEGLSNHTVHGAESLLDWLNLGNNNRRVAATLSNPYSSRSHSVFTVTCHGGVKLHLVDLAGSERAGSRSHSISRLKEGANINKSLVALGNVISTLAEHTIRTSRGVRKRFVPYRDSVLTWLLKDTLGGNSKTVMIATISPSSACYSETVNTLRFGQRAKQIVTQPVVNEDPKEKTIRELRAEISRLRELLTQNQHQSSPTLLMPGPQPSEASPPSRSESIVNELVNNSESASKISVRPVSFKSSEPLRVKSEEFLPVLDVIPGEISVNLPRHSRRTFSVDYTNMEPRKGQLHSAARANSSSKLTKSKRPSKAELPVRSESKPEAPRRPPVAGRSEIIAGVTNRLYAKNLKKDVVSKIEETKPEVKEVPKEETSNPPARLKLLDVTRRALKAHRRRTVLTQTDFTSAMRLKEIGTDVDDLQVVLAEICHAQTNTDLVVFSDKATTCCLSPEVSFTSTGTGTSEDEFPKLNYEAHPGLSFTKYLQDNLEPRFKLVNPGTANPIYTNSVNINVSHNYMSAGEDNALRDCNFDNPIEHNEQNVCFPTPDLISNHNSLESHVHDRNAPSTSNNNLEDEKCPLKININFATSGKSTEQFLTSEFFETQPLDICARSFTVKNDCRERLQGVNLPVVCAPEVCVCQQTLEQCTKLEVFAPQVFHLQIHVDDDDAEFKIDAPLIQESVVLKSIMKPEFLEQLPRSHCDCQKPPPTPQAFAELPDSLSFHEANCKKVRFSGKPPEEDNERMLEVISKFVEEASTLMANLTVASNKIEKNMAHASSDKSYELQFTINDVSAVETLSRKLRKRSSTRKKQQNTASQTCSFSQNVGVQTPRQTEEVSFKFPENKYDSIVRDSCDRLERCIIREKSGRERRSHQEERLEKIHQPFSMHNPDWRVRRSASAGDDSSLESNPTFSDYGSLPRRKYVRKKTPSGKPSAYLRELMLLRKQIVEASREDLPGEGTLPV